MRVVLVSLTCLLMIGCSNADTSDSDELDMDLPTPEEWEASLIDDRRADVAITDVVVSEVGEGRAEVVVQAEVLDSRRVSWIRFGLRVPPGIGVEPGVVDVELPDDDRDQFERQRPEPNCSDAGDGVAFCETFWELAPSWVMSAHFLVTVPAGQPPFELEIVVNHDTGTEGSRLDLEDDLDPSNNTRSVTIG